MSPRWLSVETLILSRLPRQTRPGYPFLISLARLASHAARSLACPVPDVKHDYHITEDCEVDPVKMPAGLERVVRPPRLGRRLGRPGTRPTLLHEPRLRRRIVLEKLQHHVGHFRRAFLRRMQAVVAHILAEVYQSVLAAFTPVSPRSTVPTRSRANAPLPLAGSSFKSSSPASLVRDYPLHGEPVRKRSGSGLPPSSVQPP